MVSILQAALLETLTLTNQLLQSKRGERARERGIEVCPLFSCLQQQLGLLFGLTLKSFLRMLALLLTIITLWTPSSQHIVNHLVPLTAKLVDCFYSAGNANVIVFVWPYPIKFFEQFVIFYYKKNLKQKFGKRSFLRNREISPFE